MACRAVTFDFNGTLSDDEEILFGVYAALFADHGRPLGREEYYARLAGLSEHEIVRAWLGDRDDLDAIVRERIDRYRGAVTDGTTVSEAMRAAVRFAASRVPVAVVSGATRAEIEPVVAAAGLSDCFRAIVDDGDVARGKPHPESYELAVSILARDVPGLVAADVVAFEDTEAGVTSAKSAGVHCVALARTLPPERLRLADEIVETIDEELLRRLLA
ncbi:MAG TPA: HAD family phosphatase [Gaiellales bacterium]|jgi:beta-phosphoglucomutase|nr:HAD family phosphatase [Gaiellales bacterium]